MNGWFAMNRAMFDHPIFAGHVDRVGVWAWMIATAAWKDTRQNANGTTITVKRGQLLTSYRQISSSTGAGIKTIRNLISRLQTEDAIDTDMGTGRMLITIRNYDKYQSTQDAKGTGLGTGRAQEGHTKEEGNKVTIEEEAKASLSAERDDLAEAVLFFKAIAARQDWPTIKILSKSRESALRARLKDGGGLDGWKDALNRAAKSDHCNGQNERGWVCNFDFLVQAKSFAKLIEGNYDNRESKQKGNGHDKLNAALEAGRQWDRRRGMDSGPDSDTVVPLLPARLSGGVNSSGND